MKAISCHPVWAYLIRERQKTLEIRSRPTRHRGTILICASQRPRYGDLPGGVTVCRASIIDCRPMRPEDEADSGVAYRPGHWAWVLADVQPVHQHPVKGRLGFYDLPAALAAALPN